MVITFDGNIGNIGGSSVCADDYQYCEDNQRCITVDYFVHCHSLMVINK